MKINQVERNEIIQKQIAGILKSKTKHLPVYTIINNPKEASLPETPILIRQKQQTMGQLTANIRQKYPKCAYFYIFYKQKPTSPFHNLSLNQKRKLKKQKFVTNEQYNDQHKLIIIQNQISGATIGEMYGQYKDQSEMLVVIASTVAMVEKKEGKGVPLKEALFIVLALVCAGFYIFLELAREGPADQATIL